jgi:hypothetical protein
VGKNWLKIFGVTYIAKGCVCVIATKCNKTAALTSMRWSWFVNSTMQIMKKN